MVVHTFGDSHSNFSFKTIDNVLIHWLGPKTCYSFGKKKLDILNIKNYNINDNDVIIFCFGEIDCRANIHKHVNEENSYQNIINDIVKNYFEAIYLNVKDFSSIKTLIFNIVPPTDVNLMHNDEEIQKFVLTKNANEIPWKGSNEERKNYHLYFNKKLKEFSNKYNFIFLDIYNKYCDDNGFLKRELSDGNVHINDGIYIKEFLKQHDLLT